jgi:GDP-4-dehydro-6-deoxy-D-mannose reductase
MGTGPGKTWVTGSRGFVGARLAAALRRRGEDVVGLDLTPASGEPPSPEGSGREVVCDLGDRLALEEIYEENTPERIYHLAARSSAGRSFREPQETFRANFIGTLNLLETCREGDPTPCVLFVGSSEEYGPRPEEAMPLTEDLAPDPASPYAASKAAGTLLCRQYHRAYGVPIVIARAFSHSGPGQQPVFALPSWARQIARIEAGLGEPVLRVGNLEPRRDYVSVDDVVEGYAALMEKGRPGEVYNVCTGRPHAMRDLLELLLGASANEIRVEVDPARLRPTDIPFMWGDPGKIERETGWRARREVEDWIPELLEDWRGRVKTDESEVE